MARRLGAKFKKQRRDRATAEKTSAGPARFLGKTNKVSEERARKARKKNAFRSY